MAFDSGGAVWLLTVGALQAERCVAWCVLFCLSLYRARKADRLRTYVGRPVMYRKGDFSTPEPELGIVSCLCLTLSRPLVECKVDPRPRYDDRTKTKNFGGPTRAMC